MLTALYRSHTEMTLQLGEVVYLQAAVAGGAVHGAAAGAGSGIAAGRAGLVYTEARMVALREGVEIGVEAAAAASRSL